MLQDQIQDRLWRPSNPSTPPDENDYSIALKVSYGQIDYFTAGDIGGDYAYGTYNNVETTIAPWLRQPIRLSAQASVSATLRHMRSASSR